MLLHSQVCPLSCCLMSLGFSECCHSIRWWWRLMGDSWWNVSVATERVDGVSASSALSSPVLLSSAASSVVFAFLSCYIAACPVTCGWLCSENYTHCRRKLAPARNANKQPNKDNIESLLCNYNEHRATDQRSSIKKSNRRWTPTIMDGETNNTTWHRINDD